MKYRRTLDSKDWVLVFAKEEKYPHLLEDNLPHRYNPVTGQIASTDVNVADSIIIVEKMSGTK